MLNPQNQVEGSPLDKIAEARVVPTADDSKAEQEEQQFDQSGLQARIEDVVAKRLENIATADTIKARRFFTSRLFWITYAWLILVLIIVLADGWKWGAFTLPDGVLIALITTTTINVIAVFKAVTEHLFPVAKKKTETADSSEDKKSNKALD